MWQTRQWRERCCWILLAALDANGAKELRREKFSFKAPFKGVFLTEGLIYCWVDVASRAEAGFLTWHTKSCEKEHSSVQWTRWWCRKKNAICNVSLWRKPQTNPGYCSSRQLLIATGFQSHFLLASLRFVFLFDVLLLFKVSAPLCFSSPLLASLVTTREASHGGWRHGRSLTSSCCFPISQLTILADQNKSAAMQHMLLSVQH